jgi:hypothetical protein
MSQENVDLVRSIYTPQEHGDYSSAEWADPEIEYVIADGPTPGRWTGLAGMAEGWRGFLSAWEEFRPEVDEYRELDDERVLVLSHYSAARQDERTGARADTGERSGPIPYPRGQGDESSSSTSTASTRSPTSASRQEVSE